MTEIAVHRIFEESSTVAKVDIELALFIKAIQDYYGYDFADYQRSSLKRRVAYLVDRVHLQHISELLPKIFHQDGFLETVISELSVDVTELFRDPWTFVAMQEHVFPLLKTYPNLRVWHAGCSTGEEVFSLSILLKEANLLNHATLYATDINIASLEIAASGKLQKILSKDDVKSYQQAGGHASLINYFPSCYDFSKIDNMLLKSMTFEQHNLVHDGVFCNVQLILCRNVLIYFNLNLQNKVLQLLSDSLARGGFLVLGPKELPISPTVEKFFKVIDKRARIYQKIA